jgi:uncharacterized RDD family membrane protein YckC
LDLNTQTSAQLNFELAELPQPAAAAPASDPEAMCAHADAPPAANLKQQVADALAAHRTQHPAEPPVPTSTRRRTRAGARSSRVADAVAARYAHAQSYREFLAAEAGQALRRAEAAAEVATRNAQAIAAEHQSILSELAIEQQQHSAESEQFLLAAEAAPAVETDRIYFAEAAADEFAVETLLDYAPAEFEEPYTPTPLPANLIQFPRILVAQHKVRPRLAEGPLREVSEDPNVLRIVEDAPAAPPPPPALPVWSNLRLDDAIAFAAAAAPIAPPPPQLHTAHLSPRLRAATADSALVALATSGFVAVFIKLAHRFSVMPEKKSALVAALAVFVVLQFAYQLLFFTFNDATPGMRMARIGLCTFTEENPSRATLRRRVAATLLAAVPMGLGLLWAWVDEDRLGWHDRLTHTYQRSY